MAEPGELETLEREAYRASWSDGIVDTYLGISLIWIGANWIWLPDLAGLAGVLPAVLVTPMLALRKRFVEPRLGYVRWRAPRRRWERRNIWASLMAGVVVFMGGVMLFLYLSGGGAAPALNLAPGILAWLLALLAVGLALLMSLWRMLIYALVLAASGVVVVVTEANPGWPMLACGVVATIIGLILFNRFAHRYRVIEPS